MNGPEVQPILDSAEQAAASGDYLQAESLLREVARLQAESLGPKHPDLASTFNNLGVVCERANKLMDAGRFYREALSIASASLDAEDPLVVTSRNNFDEFHRGLGLVDTEASQNIDVPTPIEEHVAVQTTAAHDRKTGTTLATITESPESPRLAIVAGIAAGVALLVTLAVWWARTPANQRTTDDTRVVEQRLSELGDPLVQVTPAAPSQKDAPATDAIVAPPVPTTEAVPARTIISPPAKVDAHVLEASLCQSLSTSGGQWDCTPTSDLGAGESLYFYTRIAAPTNMRIYHRWYRNGSLRQDVALLVHANPASGYRTYSLRRVEAGDWRVAVVDADGAVLGEANLEVR
jgi:DUF2914 family protein/tetratricopeptide repeat protein